jgi:hypothetical protein
MVTLLASTALRRIARHEVMGHLATLEQATRAVHEGYVGPPLYHQAAHTAQRLLALVQTMAWDEGTRLAHEITGLFQPTTPFGLVQALHLSDLIAAFYRGMVRRAARQTPRQEKVARSMPPLLVVGMGTLSWLAAVVIMAAVLFGGLLLLNALVQRYWPQEVHQSVHSASTGPADRAAAPEDPQKVRASAVRR